MSRVCLLAFFAMSLALATSLPAAAQDHALLAELYGEGVHSYFAGDNQAAYKSLTEAIEGGTDDPRAFYFRGLVLERMGRGEAAVSDFEAGAVAEVQDTDRYYNVNVSLQRVQGYARLAIEDYRQEARLAQAEEVSAQQRLRYERRQSAEVEVLRGAPQPSTRDFEEVAPRAISGDPDDDLFGDGGFTEQETPAEPIQQDDFFDAETGSGAASGAADTGSGMEDDLFPAFDNDPADEGGLFDDPSDNDDTMLPEPRAGADSNSDTDEGPGGGFGLGDAVDGIFGGGGRPQGNFEAGPPGMDDSEMPYEDGDEDLSVDRDGNHQAGPPGMDDPEFPYAEDDAQNDPFADDTPRPEMQDGFLEQGDPVRQGDGRPTMQDEFLREADPLQPSDGRETMGEGFEREEGGVLEEGGVPAADAVEDGPGGEADFDELFGS